VGRRVGRALYRLAMTAVVNGADALRRGDLAAMAGGIGMAEITALFPPPA